MSNQIQTLQEEVSALKGHNNELMAVLNSDTPLTHKIKAMLDMPKIRAEYLALLPDAANKEQLLRAETQAMIFDIMQSSELQQCTPQSFLFCLKESLARGLRIGSTHKEAWLIKFNNKKKGPDNKDIWVNEAKIMVGYRAYLNKAWNENGIRFTVDTIAQEEVQYVKNYSKTEGILDIHIPLGKETRLHTKENIAYVYVTALYPDGKKWSQLFTTEAMEEKSKTAKWEGKGDEKRKIMKLGQVWESSERKTDYKEMLHKAAIIQFSKMMPERSLAELADFDHTNMEAIMQDVTPDNNVSSTPTQAINDILKSKALEADSSYDLETGEVISTGGESDKNQHQSIDNIEIIPGRNPMELPQIKIGTIQNDLGNQVADWNQFVNDYIAAAHEGPDAVWLNQLRKKHESPLNNLKKENEELYSSLMSKISEREKE